MIAIKDYYTIKLHDTDAAGIIFFANQLRLVHDLYEQFLGQIGFGFRERIDKRDFFIPIVHAETDFLQPLGVGEKIEITLEVENIGKTSFTNKYQLFNLEGGLVGTAKTVHVTMDPKTREKIELPLGLRKKLEATHGAD